MASPHGEADARRPRPRTVAGATVILAAAVGVIVACVAALVAPGDETTAVASGATSPMRPGVATTAQPLTREAPTTPVLVVPTTQRPPGSVRVITPAPTLALAPPDVEVGDSSSAPTASSTRSGAPVTLAQRIASRLTRQLGASNRGVTNRVIVTLDGHLLTVAWALNRPHAANDGDVPDDASRESARVAELRVELRRVLRSLARSTLSSVEKIALAATYPRDASSEPADAIVLDATLRGITLVALAPDDVRLDDASLEELLGLAEVAAGDAAWGVPPAPPPTDRREGP